jgi:hypothetical protein
VAAILAGACGGKPAEPVAAVPARAGSADDVLWEVPPLPWPITLEINGHAVDPVVVEGYLMTPWSEHMTAVANAGAEPSAEVFLADPRALLTPLVRGMLLIHEAEARWPALAAEESAAMREEMARGAGGAYAALLERIGEESMNAHVARELRKRKLLAEFMAEAGPATDEEVFRRYDEIMADIEDPGELLARGVNFEMLEPRIRAELERERGLQAQEAWIDGQLPDARVRVRLPDGREVNW